MFRKICDAVSRYSEYIIESCDVVNIQAYVVLMSQVLQPNASSYNYSYVAILLCLRCHIALTKR